ncbi:MAG: hypothetical protein U0904_03295 [Candidatus Nanopelagicales bacterium]|nr:hypothetical protein [Candidatus Nanopelagicales bacterium]
MADAGAPRWTLAHCGGGLLGEFAYTVDLTDVVTGWTKPVAIKNMSHRWMIAATDEITARLPFELVGGVPLPVRGTGVR